MSLRNPMLNLRVQMVSPVDYSWARAQDRLW
jgi:hypothetical protein